MLPAQASRPSHAAPFCGASNAVPVFLLSKSFLKGQPNAVRGSDSTGGGRMCPQQASRQSCTASTTRTHKHRHQHTFASKHLSLVQHGTTTGKPKPFSQVPLTIPRLTHAQEKPTPTPHPHTGRAKPSTQSTGHNQASLQALGQHERSAAPPSQHLRLLLHPHSYPPISVLLDPLPINQFDCSAQPKGPAAAGEHCQCQHSLLRAASAPVRDH